MSAPVILLAAPNNDDARRIAGAMAQLGLPRPVALGDGEDVSLWLRANDCAVCVLDYELPGINGVETLLRIRQRKPELPVIMISGAKSERAAVDAFHAGVLDYIPKNPGFEEAVVSLVRQVLQSDDGRAIVPSQLIGPGVPERLIKPTYENRLRVIGRHLDLYGYRSANILEVVGGVLVRGLPEGSRSPEALEFLDRDFPQLVATAIAARGEGERRNRAKSTLMPTGYEDFLRALGHRLDGHLAEAVTISELGDFVAVGGVAKVDATGQTTVGPLQWLLREDDTTYMLDEAYRRREPVAQSRSGSMLGRLTGRRETA